MRLKAKIAAAAGLASLALLALAGPASAYRITVNGTRVVAPAVPFFHVRTTTTPQISSTVSVPSVTRSTLFVNGRRMTVTSMGPAAARSAADLSYVVDNGAAGQLPVAGDDPQAMNDDSWAPTVVLMHGSASSAPTLTSVNAVWHAVLAGKASLVPLRVPMGTANGVPNAGHIDGSQYQ
jgi:hypothetical protein